MTFDENGKPHFGVRDAIALTGSIAYRAGGGEAGYGLLVGLGLRLAMAIINWPREAQDCTLPVAAPAPLPFNLRIST